jgi:hypothetical protein
MACTTVATSHLTHQPPGAHPCINSSMLPATNMAHRYLTQQLAQAIPNATASQSGRHTAAARLPALLSFLGILWDAIICCQQTIAACATPLLTATPAANNIHQQIPQCCWCTTQPLRLGHQQHPSCPQDCQSRHTSEQQDVDQLLHKGNGMRHSTAVTGSVCGG